MEQTKQGPLMKINLHSPIVIIKNLRNESESFDMDFGNILVDSKVLNKPGRWIQYDQKPLYTTLYDIKNHDMKF